MQVSLNAHIRKRQVPKMGTCYKGRATYFRSIGQNVMIASQSYKYVNGYFGDVSASTGNRTRNIVSSDNLATANDFYNKIAYGGTEISRNNGNLKITTMSDGTIITKRNISSSDGTPVVEINIRNSTHNGDVKYQKIHFVKEAE